MHTRHDPLPQVNASYLDRSSGLRTLTVFELSETFGEVLDVLQAFFMQQRKGHLQCRRPSD